MSGCGFLLNSVPAEILTAGEINNGTCRIAEPNLIARLSRDVAQTIEFLPRAEQHGLQRLRPVGHATIGGQTVRSPDGACTHAALQHGDLLLAPYGSHCPPCCPRDRHLYSSLLRILAAVR